MICPVCRSSHAQAVAQPVASAYAGFWIRFVAYLIDLIILAIGCGAVQRILVGSMFGIPRFDPGTGFDIAVLAPLIGVSILVQLTVSACYEGFFVAKLGATPGKMVIGTKVVCADGSPVSLGRAFGRYFAKILSSLILCIGFILIGFDSQKRGLHDLICDTRVVKSRN
jgi:uncharacterized RDD family membrane protein YckC